MLKVPGVAESDMVGGEELGQQCTSVARTE